MTRTRLIALGFVAVAVAVAAITVTNRSRDRRFQALAQAYRQQALKDLAPSPSATGAISWLERNGFEVALYDGSVAAEEIEHTPQGEKKCDFVSGYRRVAPASSMHAERWVELRFFFQATDEPFVPGEFLDLEVYDDSTPKKAWKSEFARRAATRPGSATP